MSTNDINNLGQVYGGMLNGLKKELIKEGKVGPGEIGEADLQDGGPQEEGGFAEAEVDAEKLSAKKEQENLYDIYKHTQRWDAEEDEEDGTSVKQEILNQIKINATTGLKSLAASAEDYYDFYRSKGDEDRASICRSLMNHFASQPEIPATNPGTPPPYHPEDEEDQEGEESSQISEKIARDGLNNFMKQKSVFDKLYDKVMVNENFDEMQDEDFDALGLDDATPDDELEGEGDEITVTLSKDVAQTLCDVLQAAMGESDDEDGNEGFGEDEGFGGDEGGFAEEDEEGIDTGSTFSTSYDDGKNNKVGDLSPAGAATAKGANIKLDAGSNQSTSYNDGKNNKVGNLTKGKRLVDR